MGLQGSCLDFLALEQEGGRRIKVLSGLALANDFHRHGDVFVGLVALLVGGDTGHFGNFIAARNHVAKNRMTVIQPRCRYFRDEELRTVCARAAVGHRQDAGAVVAQVGVEFVREGVAGIALTRTQGVAALAHELRNDAVEDQAIVERLAALDFRFGVVAFSEGHKVGHRHGGLFHFKFDQDVAFVRLEQGVQTVLNFYFFTIDFNRGGRTTRD